MYGTLNKRQSFGLQQQKKPTTNVSKRNYLLKGNVNTFQITYIFVHVVYLNLNFTYKYGIHFNRTINILYINK